MASHLKLSKIIRIAKKDLAEWKPKKSQHWLPLWTEQWKLERGKHNDEDNKTLKGEKKDNFVYRKGTMYSAFSLPFNVWRV